jgi:hypothetical protein
MSVRTNPSATTGALAEQSHLIDEIEHPDLVGAFERLAAEHAPAVTWSELNAHERQLVDDALARTAPGTPGHRRLFGDDAH